MLASLREACSFQKPKEMMGDRGLYSIQGVDIGIHVKIKRPRRSSV
jgi:hypothetical protein